jgi:PAS domain-containing protein
MAPERDPSGLASQISRATVDRRRRVLARVREAVWRTRHDANVKRVLTAVWKGLRELGLAFDDCALHVVEDAPSLRLRSYHRRSAGSSVVVIDPDEAGRILQIWKAGRIVHSRNPAPAGALRERQLVADSDSDPGSRVELPFSRGTLTVSRRAGDEFSSADLETLEEVTEGLSEGFRRKEDFRLLERRNQELEGKIAACREASEKLRRATGYFNRVIESLPHPFYVIDAETYRIMLANSSAEMGELSEDSTCYALTHRRDSPCEDSEHPCPLQTVKQTKSPVAVEHIHFGVEGNPVNVEVHAYPVFDREGNVSQLIEYSLDITDRKRAERALRAMERVRVLTETAGATAHELNQPLQAISIIAQGLLRTVAQDDVNRSKLERILELMDRIGAILSKMKDVQGYVTTPYTDEIDIVDFDRSSRKSEEEQD